MIHFATISVDPWTAAEIFVVDVAIVFFALLALRRIARGK